MSTNNEEQICRMIKQMNHSVELESGLDMQDDTIFNHRLIEKEKEEAFLDWYRSEFGYAFVVDKSSEILLDCFLAGFNKGKESAD